jgi:hypothetical protein
MQWHSFRPDFRLSESQHNTEFIQIQAAAQILHTNINFKIWRLFNMLFHCEIPDLSITTLTSFWENS